MNESLKAIEKLKIIIEKNYISLMGVSEEDIFSLLKDVEDILKKTISIATKDNLKLELTLLEKTVPVLIEECITSFENYNYLEVLPSISKIRTAVISYYFLVSSDGLRAEKERKQLLGDINNLEKKKSMLESQLADLTQIVSIENELKKYRNESVSIITDIRNSQALTDEEVARARGKLTIMEDVFGSVEEVKNRENEHIENLQKLCDQASEMSERIKGILSDVNRDSMAASFRERKDELDESIKKSDYFNHSALIAIFLLSFTLFAIPIVTMLFGKPITDAIDAKFFYERFLIVLPLGFISWFTSRRSQYLFQLREDYAYKYSSAMAFEGYKRQAEMNEEMHNELLKIAITNLGKTPTSIFDRDLKHAPTDKIVDAVKEVIPKIK